MTQGQSTRLRGRRRPEKQPWGLVASRGSYLASLGALTAMTLAIGACSPPGSSSQQPFHTSTTGTTAASTSTTDPAPATSPLAVVGPPTTPMTFLTVPPVTSERVVSLTNPEDLYYALEQTAQQLMGGNDADHANVDAFIAWYHQQEAAFQTGQTNVEPPTPRAAAQYWINTYFPTQVEGNNFLKVNGAITCMIQNSGPGPCPTSGSTPTTMWP